MINSYLKSNEVKSTGFLLSVNCRVFLNKTNLNLPVNITWADPASFRICRENAFDGLEMNPEPYQLIEEITFFGLECSRGGFRLDLIKSIHSQSLIIKVTSVNLQFKSDIIYPHSVSSN
jgi:hypothetical protein